MKALLQDFVPVSAPEFNFPEPALVAASFNLTPAATGGALVQIGDSAGFDLGDGVALGIGAGAHGASLAGDDDRALAR